MASIKLTWDKNKRLFSFPIMIMRSSSEPTGFQNQQHVKTEIYVDTGSSITSITDSEASLLGLDINRLPTEKTAGISGMTSTHYASDLTLIALSSGNPVPAKLSKIAVLPSNLVNKREKTRGEFKETRTYESIMVCLCGLDLLEYWRGKLILDLEKKTGVIEIN